MANPFEEDELYTQEHPTLAGKLPTEEQEARQRVRTDAYRRFNSISPQRQMRASGRQFVGGMPIIGALAQSYTNPPGGSEGRQDLEDLRTGSPGTSGALSIAGGSAPYMALGAGLPALLNTGTRAALVTGGTEAADAAMRGGNPLQAGVVGGISGLVGGAPSKLISPSTPFQARRIAAGHRGTLDNILEEATNANVNALKRIKAAGGSASDITQQQREASRRIQQQVHDAQNPPMNIPPVTDPAFRDTISGGIVGSGLSMMAGQHPLLGGAVGALAYPAISKFIKRRANESIAEFNERVGSTRAARAVNRTWRAYMDRSRLTDEHRALLNVLSAQSGQELINNMQTVPPAPTLGGQ